MNATRVIVALFLLTLAAGAAAAAGTQTPYEINGGGTYQYKPPGFGPGIPGGVPSNYELDFGISGTFIYELDIAGPTARFLSLNLTLTGNEAIQAAPPANAPVTADRVEAYLASQVFVENFIGGLLHLKSSTVPGLTLTDSLNGSIFLNGGYDNTPVDGDSVQFQFSAVVVPEPAAAALFAAAVPALQRVRQRRR